MTELGRSPGWLQEIDVHVGLDSTVVMLGHRPQGVEVVREHDRSLPKIPAYAAELTKSGRT